MTSRVPVLSITAMAAVNALGASTSEVLAALDESRSGLRPAPFPLHFPTVVGAVPGALDALPPTYRAYDCHLARLGMRALDEVESATLAARTRWGNDRIGIFLGTSTGGLDATEDAYASWVRDGSVPASFDLRRMHDFSAIVDLFAARLGIDGPRHVISTACSSSAKVHATAQRYVAMGLIDAAIVGGIDTLCRMTLYGFRGLGILSEHACRPFTRGRDGINIGEGAALMLLERETPETSERARARLLGVGESADAYNMSSPEPEGRGAGAAIARALAQAGLERDDVDLMIAHGTATPQNDSAEARAIAREIGSEVPVISTKGYTGHQLGAAGGTSAIFAVHALERGIIPASLGEGEPDPELAIHVVRRREDRPLRAVLANAFAFGGSNVCLAVGHADTAR